MIVTLAGHVDHGKTSIVRALTGVDTDRLEEEKRRGLTIDLGFAYVELGEHRVGFVDVPGHHRFVHNMVAGVASMQHALLVVAADDGVMPQTREHFQILDLLGVSDGVVVVNKIDRVAPERITEVHIEIEALVGGTFLRDASVIDISCADGRGIDELRSELERAAAGHAIEQADDEFRLAIDRTFNVRGAGLVVTGTVVSGSVRTGDTVAVAASGNSLRVRSLHVQDRTADVASVGDRAAINLTGAARDVLSRGDWIVAPSALKSTAHPCIALAVLADFPRPVKHWAPVHVYHATSHCQARIGLLEGAPVEPGGHALVDLICDEPLHVKIGDRVIVRDQDLGRTMGGGTVIDLEVPVGRRRHPRRRERLASLAELDIREAANWLSLRQVVSLDDFGRSWNIKAERVQTFVSDLGLVKRGDQVVHPELFERFKADVTTVLEAHHREIADSDGMSAVELRTKLAADVQTLEFVLAALVDADFLRVRNGRYAVPTHQAEIPKALQSLFDAMKTLLDSNQPPSLGDLAKSLDRPLKVFSRDMRALVAVGLCIQVSPNRFYLSARLHAMADIANTLNSRSPFTVRDFRDASGVGRNVVIEVLEYFDTRGFTRREGDQRRVIASIESTLDG